MVPPEGRTRSATRGRKKPPHAGSPVPERDCHTLSGSNARSSAARPFQRAGAPRRALRRRDRSIRAAAYTIGDAVAFDGWPDFHTAVHEAAHVVQQRRGVSRSGCVSREHDLCEQHADAVADAVAAGRSAAPLLDGPSAASGIARTALEPKTQPLPKVAIPSSDLDPMDTPAETAFMVAKKMKVVANESSFSERALSEATPR